MRDLDLKLLCFFFCEFFNVLNFSPSSIQFNENRVKLILLSIYLGAQIEKRYWWGNLV